MLQNLLNAYELFLMIFIRMSGALLVNPLFGRRNIPNHVKVGLTVALSAALTVSVPVAAPEFLSVADFVLKGLTEFAIGYAVSMVMTVFFSTILMAADLIDMQLGIGMAKVFDPGSNVSAPITGSLYNAFFVCLFFAGNGHLTLFKLLSDSVIALPCGVPVRLANAAFTLTGLLGNALTLALKFALPIVAVEFISEVGLGVLTRAVPHVNIFSIGIQMKLFVGLFVLVLVAPLFGSFCDSVNAHLFRELSRVFRFMQ